MERKKNVGDKDAVNAHPPSIYNIREFSTMRYRSTFIINDNKVPARELLKAPDLKQESLDQ
jgi:hypothetical protein